MNKLYLLGLALLCGFAGGWAGSVFTGGSAAPEQAGTDLEASLPSGTEVDADRILELEADLSSLQVTMDLLRSDLSQLGRPEASGPVGRFELPLPGTEGADLAQAQIGDWGPALDERVNAVLEAREEAERLERERRQAEARERMLDNRVARMAEELGLDEFQAAELKRVMTETEQQRNDMFRQFRDMRETGGGSWENIGPMMEQLQQSARSQLASVLTPTQLEQVSDRDLFGGRGGFGGRGSDRGGQGTGGGRGGRGGF